MRWQLYRMLAQQVVRGRLGGFTELEKLKRYRAGIDDARSNGGELAPSPPETDREGLLMIERRWYGPSIHRAGPTPGVMDVLAYFAARDIPQVVLSDYHAQYKLESLGLEDRFASTYEGESMGFVKPSPVGFQRIIADYGISAESLLHIGDRADTDGAGSRAAGCQCRILGRDFRGFDVLLEELRSSLG
jgi:FMN phosphatase YigB (HAD superfamily)